MKKLLGQLRNKKVRRILLSIITLIIVVSGALYYLKTNARVFIDNSLIQAPVISISPSNPEKLLETDVYEGQYIKKGDQLAVTSTETLRSDTDGLIVMANTQVGSTVSSLAPVIQLVRVPDLRVVGTIDENKGLKDITVGQVVSFTIDALPGKTFWGYVDEIGPSAKTTQLSFSISSERPTQQFQVYARFPAADHPEIKNGMSAKMTVYTGTN